jgi:hypothetical protein
VLQGETQSNACALYTSTHKRDDVLVPFLLEGLRREQKCLVWLTDPKSMNVAARLGSPAAEDWLASGQLQVRSLADTIFSSGTFWIEEVVALWEDEVCAAVTIGGFNFARIACEANSCLSPSHGHDVLIHYEAMLSSLSARYPAAILSLYDISVPDGGLIFDLVRTHPRILLDGMSVENPHYLTSEQLPLCRAVPASRTPSPAALRTPNAIAV